MKNTVRQEIQKIIEEENLNCSIKEFKDEVCWYEISRCQQLSEDFIKEFKDKMSWYYISAFQKLSENFIREFKDEIDWHNISKYQQLSLDFIREFKDEVNWISILINQQLSESFIREFKDEVDWDYISSCQQLSEDFIREFKDKVEWNGISIYQQLSENFIREFKDKVDWYEISSCQQLSENFIEEFKEYVDVESYNEIHKTISYEEKLKQVKKYCKKYNLKLDEENKCFYAYRNHDEFGRGMFNKAISYEKGKYYRDWHLDMRENVENSFGLGIWPEGNIKVKVLIEDFGVWVNRYDGKLRVWGFEIV